MTTDASPRPYPLFDTTFTLFRVSPLYAENLTDHINLERYARNFRDILARDVLRGVRVGLGSGPEDDALARVGALQSVTWEVLQSEDASGVEGLPKHPTVSAAPGRGILVEVTYEKAIYRAVLLRMLPEQQDDRAGHGFLHFPLLLVRMPASLRETFTDFLATTFDARISHLHLSTTYLTTALETYIETCSDVLKNDGALVRTIGDVNILVGFEHPVGSSSLQTIEFKVDAVDIPQLVQRGKIGDTKSTVSPFMNALSTFIEAHLALDLRHEAVQLLKIACAGVILGAEGRAKISPPISVNDDEDIGKATSRLFDDLIEVAKGGKMGTLPICGQIT
jgi:hypothetical protein